MKRGSWSNRIIVHNCKLSTQLYLPLLRKTHNQRLVTWIQILRFRKRRCSSATDYWMRMSKRHLLWVLKHHILNVHLWEKCFFWRRIYNEVFCWKRFCRIRSRECRDVIFASNQKVFTTERVLTQDLTLLSMFLFEVDWRSQMHEWLHSNLLVGQTIPCNTIFLLFDVVVEGTSVLLSLHSLILFSMIPILRP